MPVHDVHNFLALIVYFQDHTLAELPKVVRLPSRVGIERGAIQHHRPRLPGAASLDVRRNGLATEHLGREFAFVSVVVVNAMCSHEWKILAQRLCPSGQVTRV